MTGEKNNVSKEMIQNSSFAANNNQPWLMCHGVSIYKLNNYSRNTSKYMICRVKNKNYWISNWLVDPKCGCDLSREMRANMYVQFTKCL
jgi:hypothetical protein